MSEVEGVEVKYPLLYKPRPWSAIHAGVLADPRWRNVPADVDTIDVLDRLALDRVAEGRSPGR